MYRQKVISRKNCVKNFFFARIMKVNDENSRIRIQDPDPNPDPLVRGMDPRTRIRIHPKMPWIRNTGSTDPDSDPDPLHWSKHHATRESLQSDSVNICLLETRNP